MVIQSIKIKIKNADSEIKPYIEKSLQEIESDFPAAEVAKLSIRFGGEVPELAVIRPSLEDIYLKMIGQL